MVENSFLPNQAIDNQDHLGIISAFAIDLLNLNSVQETLWHLARNVIAQLGFIDVVIYLYEPESKMLIQAAAFGNKSPEHYVIKDPIEIALNQGVVGTCAASQQAIRICDTRTFPGYIVDDDIRLSELAVPMLSQGKLIGVIDSEHPDSNFYTEQDEQTLKVLASIAATKITSSRSFEKLQATVEQLEYSSKIQEVLFDIAELIFKTDSLADFYYQLHQCVKKLTYADNFYIALIDEDNASASISYGLDDKDSIPVGKEFKLEVNPPTLTTHAISLDQPTLLNEYSISKLIKQKQLKVLGSTPQYWLGVPFGNSNLKGIVVIQSYDIERSYGQNDVMLLNFAAKHIHSAIERMLARNELTFLALHDPLTKLPNRSLFLDRTDHALKQMLRHKENRLAVFFIDFDDFKHVNDTYSHSVGDKLLMQVAERIKGCIRESDTVCRLGGDEFAILLEEINTLEQAQKIADKVINAIRAPFVIEQFEIFTSSSIGMSFNSGEETTAETLLKQADEAMYQAKFNGKNQVKVYKSDCEQATASYKLALDLIPAVEQDQFVLHFQPIVCLEKDTIIAAEALVRWNHPEHGFIPPDKFIPEFEKNGCIAILDEYVFKQAIVFIERWEDKPEEFRLSINLSSAGFASEVIKSHIKHYWQTAPNLLKHITLEITEQTLVNNVKQTQKNMQLYREMGLKISLDDFGTGYSSLSYLHMFTFDSLKIDRSFVSSYEAGHNSSTILESIINLANSIGINAIAEGIETQEQYKLLQKLGGNYGQGFLMAKPLIEEDFVTASTQSPRFWIKNKGA
ncbi:EAL domain-containing protein [Thalassotalea sp. M1531]|uniref:EAL domain-containing protein n=1 Tax=Thalassotalea algicola TaxID=2716224 RepID=A0A7Y0LEA6_9GAMM|nr:EAL domain-containing protein [Thalassotalea algicola]NMP32086.1 EAL domain-containing protein [Thalassotalea algicola]